MSASSPEAPPGVGPLPGGAPRVGIIGATRRRQGLGPFVIRDLRSVGALVPCFLATRPETRDAAQTDLARRFEIECRGYLDVEEMLREEELDALAILSPSATHAEYLDRALDAGLHVLCEKPLLWEVRDLAARAANLARGFEARGLVLHENCQWPYTLPAFASLHPGVLDEPIHTFEMQMQPVNPGVGRLGDSLPHALSLVQALAPGDARIEDLAFAASLREGSELLDITFIHRTSRAAPRVRVSLERSDVFPRRFAYAVNGRWALRDVDAEYDLRFSHADRSVDVDDPLPRLVADFVSEVVGRHPPARRGEIVLRARLMEEIVLGYLRWDQAGAP